MKIRISVGIYGVHAKLNLDVKILYGKTNQYEKKIFRKEFSLDDGGQVDLPMNFFQEYANEAILEKCQEDVKINAIYETIYDVENNNIVEKAKSIIIACDESECERIVKEELFGAENRFGGTPINFTTTKLDVSTNKGVLCTEAYY